MKYPIFQLQINDYIQCSYFRENFSYIGKCYDSSFDHDTGKKLTYLIVLFPNEVILTDRYIEVNLYEQNKINDNNGKKNVIKLLHSIFTLPYLFDFENYYLPS